MPSLSLACTRFSNLIMFESILLHNFIFCLFKHGLCLNFYFTRRYIRGLCYMSRGGHFNFFQVWISLVSVKEFIIAIIICKMRNSVGLLFFFLSDWKLWKTCYYLVYMRMHEWFECWYIRNGCIFKISFLLIYDVCM